MPFHSGKSAKARKIAGSLVAVFPHASPPLVWKFDLEKNHSFTFTMQGEEGDWELGVTSPRGEFYGVARFLSRDDAEEAFNRTRCALLKKERRFWTFAGPISLALFILLLLAVSLVPFNHSGPQMTSTVQGGSPIVKPGNIRDGYPMPADQVLIAPE